MNKWSCRHGLVVDTSPGWNCNLFSMSLWLDSNAHISFFYSYLRNLHECYLNVYSLACPAHDHTTLFSLLSHAFTDPVYLKLGHKPECELYTDIFPQTTVSTKDFIDFDNSYNSFNKKTTTQSTSYGSIYVISTSNTNVLYSSIYSYVFSIVLTSYLIPYR